MKYRLPHRLAHSVGRHDWESPPVMAVSSFFQGICLILGCAWQSCGQAHLALVCVFFSQKNLKLPVLIVFVCLVADIQWFRYVFQVSFSVLLCLFLSIFGRFLWFRPRKSRLLEPCLMLREETSFDYQWLMIKRQKRQARQPKYMCPTKN